MWRIQDWCEWPWSTGCRDTAVPAEGNGDLQTLICVLVVRPRRCPTFSNPVRWQNWMAAYLGYTLRMKTLFRGWPVMVHDTHAIRRRLAEHRRRTLQTDQKHCRINYVYYILQMHTVCNVCSALCLNAWPKYFSKAKICNGHRHMPPCPACANEK